MNITLPSSSLEQINFILEDWGTNPSNSSIEFSFRTCSVAMEANGLGCGCGLELVSPELSSSRLTSGVTKIVLLGLKGIPLTSRFISTRGCVFNKGLFGAQLPPADWHVRRVTVIDNGLKKFPGLEPKIGAMMREVLEKTQIALGSIHVRQIGACNNFCFSSVEKQLLVYHPLKLDFSGRQSIGAVATGAATVPNQFETDTCRVGGRPGKSSGNTSGKS
ncbi:hypothetical protein Tco_0852783 [Tanacetum coccineum]